MYKLFSKFFDEWSVYPPYTVIDYHGSFNNLKDAKKAKKTYRNDSEYKTWIEKQPPDDG